MPKVASATQQPIWVIQISEPERYFVTMEELTPIPPIRLVEIQNVGARVPAVPPLVRVRAIWREMSRAEKDQFWQELSPADRDQF